MTTTSSSSSSSSSSGVITYHLEAARSNSNSRGGGGGVSANYSKDNNKISKKKKQQQQQQMNNNKKKKKQQGGGSGGAVKQQQQKTKKSKVSLPSNASKSPPWQTAAIAATSSSNNNKIMKVSKKLLSDADSMIMGWKPFKPSMDIGGMAYVGSFLGSSKAVPKIGVPEVAFLGRSNVGKSSLLNCLTSVARMDGETKDQARVGKTPGATASVNLYALLERRQRRRRNNADEAAAPKPLLGFTDLPGFGYAKLSKENKQDVEKAAEKYLDKRRELALGVLLVDSRREPSDDDKAVLAALYDLKVPLCVVATKIDKLNKNEVDGCLENIQKTLGLPNGQPLAVSSITGEGTQVLWRIIMEACEGCVAEIIDIIENGEPEQPGDYGTIKLTDDGEFIDESEYDQGFDWIHSDDDEEVMYDYEEDENFYDDYDDFDEFEDEDNEFFKR